MVFKTKNKQKNLWKSEVNRSAMNNKPKQSGMNCYCSVVGCPTSWRIVPIPRFFSFPSPQKKGSNISLPIRVIHLFMLIKDILFSKKSTKKIMEKTILITLFYKTLAAVELSPPYTSQC